MGHMQAGYPEVVSSEIGNSGSRRCQTNRKAIERRASSASAPCPAESQTPGMHRNSTCENRETPLSPAAALAGRWENAKSDTSHMHGSGESYRGIVPTKQPNESQGGPQEAVEGRPPTKENMVQSNSRRTQSRESGPSGLDRVREAELRRQVSEVGTVCVRSASTGLCGGCRVTGIPTATHYFFGLRRSYTYILQPILATGSRRRSGASSFSPT
jgi:hypothetical protein